MSGKCHGVQDDTGRAGENNGVRKIAVIGLANSGKSLLFNKFAKTYSVVANYPQTTIHSVRKETVFAGQPSIVIDTPGISSLSVTTGDEKETRKILVTEKPDLVIFCGDATHLKRTLVLLAEVQELEIPMVFCLNKVDSALEKGAVIDVKKLALEIGVPVVGTSAVRGIGLAELEKATDRAAVNGGYVKYSGTIEQAVETIGNIFPSGQGPVKGELLLLLAGDTAIKTTLGKAFDGKIAPEINSALRKIHIKTAAINIKQAIFNVRESWADKVADGVTSSSSLTFTGLSHKLAWISRHPFFG